MLFESPLRSMVHLPVGDIFDEFERRIAVYEAEISRLKKENYRQRKLLDAVYKPEIRIRRLDLQQLLGFEEEWSPSLDQEETRPQHIKKEELWSIQEGGQLLRLEEGITTLSFAPVPVKSENNPEKTHCSQLDHSRTEEASTSTEQMRTEPGGKDCGPSEPPGNSGPSDDAEPTIYCRPLSPDCCESETDDSDGDCKKTKDQRGDNQVGRRRSTEKKLLNCSVCGRGFTQRADIQRHMRIHTGERPFSCPFCGKGFAQRGSMQIHIRIHTGEKPFRCSVCGRVFSERGHMQTHMRIHTGEKPFTCSICGKKFSQKGAMQRHTKVHTGEKPFSCSVCARVFSERGHMLRHMKVHSGETSFSC
ncbi:oocyte zinc finger protein XlCOF6.1-like [Lampris incognitus]|uniref:oocyte zinc finger protein XlCOF6.1-like n=1 Tax=Lampris incognitus TaxID=2546036 RepID=UPI0024B54327|nr:oocyte zinc finger protein XlCOF6.1-like [Lampris incognitus]